MPKDSKEMYEFKRTIKFLEKQKGEGTELISLYIPPESNVNEVTNKLRDEYGQAMNIKSKQTRKNVQSAIDRIVQMLKGVNKAPKNGVAIFCGNINGKVEIFDIIPPMPLQVSMYRCDSSFYTEPLDDMMDVYDVFGLVVMDRREATLGTMKGKTVEIIRSMTSGVPGKHRKGGQCVSKDSLIFSGNGLSEIQDIDENNFILSVNADKYKTKMHKYTKVYKSKPNKAYQISTKYPALNIKITPEHWFFVAGENGIELRYAEDLKVGDHVLATKKINFKGKKIRLEHEPIKKLKINKEGRRYLKKVREKMDLSQKEAAKKVKIAQATLSKVEQGIGDISAGKIKELLKLYGENENKFFNRYMKNTNQLKIPKYLTKELSQIIGDIIGDGCIESNRIRIYEQRKKVAEYYKKLIESSIGITCPIKYNKKKNYYQITIYSKEFVDFLSLNFPELFEKNRNIKIPEKILKAENEIIAGFLGGVFDAEGYAKKGRVGLSMISEKIIKQMQMLLLRLGIISSVRKKISKGNYRVKKESIQYEIDITDENSVRNFQEFIGFTADEKNEKLKKNARARSNVDQIPITGKHIINLARKVGLNTMSFAASSNFFRNERNMSFKVFERAIAPKFRGNNEVTNFINQIKDADLIQAKISKKEEISTNGDIFYDLSVPKTECYVANGFMIHNSAQRFERFIENAAHEFYSRVGKACDEVFMDKKVKGIIVGGSGPTKHDFAKGDFMNNNAKKKILGIIDTSYTDDFGIRELVNKSEEAIKDLEIKREKDLVNKFLKEAVTNGLATYGLKEVKGALAIGQGETLLMSEDLDDKLIDELVKLADATNAEIEMISTETPEGIQFYQGFGGIGVLLRYK